MDKAFLEFWGKMFLNAARGGNQTADFAEMMKVMSSGPQDVGELIRGLSDPELFKRNSEEYFKVCRKAGEEFQESMKEFLSLMDLVPRKDYDELQKRYEDLKKALVEDKAPLVEGVLKEEILIQAEGMKVFEGVLREQARQFQNLMSGFTKAEAQEKRSQGSSSDTDGTQKTPRRKMKAASKGRGKRGK